MEIRDRFRFMLDNAGYATPPGRAVCALELARAEQLLEEAQNLSVAFTNVEADEEGTLDGAPAVGVVVGVYDVWDTTPSYRPAPSHRASLWGIEADAETDGYLRVVRAELASELADELRQAVADAREAREASELFERVAEAWPHLRRQTRDQLVTIAEAEAREGVV